MRYTDLCDILKRKRRQRVACLRKIEELNAQIKDLQKKKKEMLREVSKDTRRCNYPPLRIKDILLIFFKS